MFVNLSLLKPSRAKSLRAALPRVELQGLNRRGSNRNKKDFVGHGNYHCHTAAHAQQWVHVKWKTSILTLQNTKKSLTQYCLLITTMYIGITNKASCTCMYKKLYSTIKYSCSPHSLGVLIVSNMVLYRQLMSYQGSDLPFQATSLPTAAQTPQER